ncbi:MAG: hypothetical protein IIZ66_02005, partial [Clostridia bacterium]|nr:hypothetical protein [Clostridia bacterium]
MAVDIIARGIASGRVPITAYDMAVAGGYVGTKEEFEADMGNSGTNATNAANSADAAAASEAAALAAAGNLAPTFDAATPYYAGTYVMESGTLYRFIADHAAGAWTGTDAEAVKLAPVVGSAENYIDTAYQTRPNPFGYWQVGALNTTTGKNTTGNNRLRPVQQFVGGSNDIYGLKAKTGYEFCPFAYDASSKDYVGCLQTSGLFAPSGSAQAWVTEFLFADYPAYVYMIVIRKTNEASMTIAEAANVERIVSVPDARLHNAVFNDELSFNFISGRWNANINIDTSQKYVTTSFIPAFDFFMSIDEGYEYQIVFADENSQATTAIDRSWMSTSRYFVAENYPNVKFVCLNVMKSDGTDIDPADVQTVGAKLHIIPCRVDPGLTNAGYAADAAAVGNAIGANEIYMTATRNYAVGEFVFAYGTLYKVTENISNGGTITPGTNV